jgi:hypothetical protein
MGDVEMRRKKAGEQRIRGIILPSEWDDDGEVMSIGVETPEGEDIYVFMDTMGEKLMSFIDHRVEVTGTVEDVYGDLVLTVTGYTLLSGDD